MGQSNSAPMSLLSRLTYIPLVGLAAANVLLVLGFWGSFGGENKFTYQTIGVCLAVVEFTALVVVSDANARGEKIKAFTFGALLGLILALNTIGDFGAVATMTAADTEGRAQAIARYDAVVVAEREANAEVVRLTALLETQGRNRPIAALEAEMRAAQLRRDAFIREGSQPPRRVVDRATQAESAHATAQALAINTRTRDQTRATIAGIGARPAVAHSQFVALAELAGMVGGRVTTEQVRVALAAAVALILKLVLVFGFWAVSPRIRPSAAPDNVPMPVSASIEAELPPVAAQIEELQARRRAPRSRRLSANPMHQALDDLENGVA
jgi:hypothetical protein